MICEVWPRRLSVRPRSSKHGGSFGKTLQVTAGPNRSAFEVVETPAAHKKKLMRSVPGKRIRTAFRQPYLGTPRLLISYCTKRGSWHPRSCRL